MIDLYTWSTPNGRKVSIALEELGLDYRVLPIDITASKQFEAEFLALNPNNKIPVIYDHDNDQSLTESGSILMYLADKAGSLGGTNQTRWIVLQWLMLQMSGIGPMFGQTHYFHKYNPGVAPHAEQRFLAETHRLYGLLDQRLSEVPYLAGHYSIADIATFPWVARWPWHSIDWQDYPKLADWYRRIAARDAVQRGYNVPVSDQSIELPNV